MAKPLRARLRQLGQKLNGIPAAAAAPVPAGQGISRARTQIGHPRRGVAGVLGLGALMSVAGGLPSPRPDQALDTSSAGVAPGTSTGTLRAVLALIGGGGAGAITGVFVYNGTPSASNLIASMTNSPTDPFGTTTYRSVAAYQSGLERVAAQLSAGAVIFNRGNVINSAAVVGSNDGAPLNLFSGQVNASDLASLLSLIPALAGQVPIASLTGAFELQEAAVPAAGSTGFQGPRLFGSNATGRARFVADTHTGDGQAYDTGEATFFNTAAVPIPASGFTTVFSQAVAAITYRFSGKMRLKQGAIGSIPGNIGFTGPATSFGLWDVFWRLQGAPTTFESADTSGFAVQVNVLGSQTVAGDEVTAYFDGTVTFTAAGTFAVGCQADGTHAFTAQPGCKLKLRPVG